MQNLSVFDEEFNLIKDIEDNKSFGVALEISNYLTGASEELSKEAEDVLYIYKRKRRKLFVEAMLFVSAEEATIAMSTGMSEEVIRLYRDLFFDSRILRGPLGRTEFYEEIFEEFDVNSEEYEYGQMLKEAHIGGEDIILAQFNIMLNNDPQAYKVRAMKLAHFRYALAEAGDITFDNLAKETRARDAIITLTEKAAKKDDGHKQSDISRLYHILEKMSDMGEVGEGDISLPIFNQETEEIIDVSDVTGETTQEDDNGSDV